MKSKLIVILIALLGLTLDSSVLEAAENKKIIINSFIGVEIGADIAQYEETIGMLRNQTRKMYMDEIIEAALKLSGGNFDPTFMLAPLQRIQDSADRKRDFNKEIDSVNIGFSVGEFFKAAIEKLHKDNGLTNSERKIEFANQFPVINGRMTYNNKVQYGHYIFIQMAHVGHGLFKMTAALGNINEGTERFFEGEGRLSDAVSQIAEGIFRSIMELERPAWKNPNPKLIWVPGPANMAELSVREAKIYCSGQGARLPLADEIILASHGTAYRNGGIDRFVIGESYFVGDSMRQAGVPYIVTIENNWGSPIARVSAVAGHTGKVWCVKGDISPRNELVQKLYSVRRKLDPSGVDIRFFPEKAPAQNLLALKAVESLLIHLNAAGAELGDTLSQGDLMEVDDALMVLKEKGFDLKSSWPKN